MNIIAKYTHGSEDSLDIDTYYVVDVLPSFADSKSYCDALKDENANLITIDNGIVSGCYKGTIDEVNNSLFMTYNLHRQEYPLLVERMVERNRPLKYIRTLRGLLSHLSRSKCRKLIKDALKDGWTQRIKAMRLINLMSIDFDTLNRNMSGADIKKFFAFQIGQSLGLMDGVELYTKKSIADSYPDLRPFLYRDENADMMVMVRAVSEFLDRLSAIDVIENGTTVHFIRENMIFDVRLEKLI